jgi:hypothetical protein
MTFINDEEKMTDFLKMNMEDFLRSYSYLTIQDYMDTLKDVATEILGNDRGIDEDDS